MELIRARTSTILAGYNQILNILKGLPSGYNRDFQETKRPFIEGLRLTSACVRVMDITFTKLEVREERLVAAFKAAPEVFATDEALRLVVEGVPFRDAYRQVAASVMGAVGDPAQTGRRSARASPGARTPAHPATCGSTWRTRPSATSRGSPKSGETGSVAWATRCSEGERRDER